MFAHILFAIELLCGMQPIGRCADQADLALLTNQILQRHQTYAVVLLEACSTTSLQ